MGAAGFGAAVGAIGSILGAVGAQKSAKAQVKAAEDSRRLYDDKTLEGIYRQALSFYGPAAENYLRAALPKESADRLFGVPAGNAQFTDAQRARVAAIDDQIAALSRVGPAGPAQSTKYAQQRMALQKERDDLIAAAGGSAGKTGLIDPAAMRAYAANNPGFLQQMNALAGTQEGLGQSMLDAFGAESQQLAGEDAAASRDVQRYGEQERKRIKLTSDRALTGLNRATESRLRAGGLNDSTLMTGALTNNQRSVQEGAENAYGNVSDRQMALLNSIQQAALNRKYARAGQGTALRSSVLDRNAQFRQAPIAAQYQLAGSAAFNPYLGVSTSQFYPGVSPGGAMASSFGNTLAGAGGALIGYGLQTDSGGADNRSLQQMRRDAVTAGGIPYRPGLYD